MLRDASLASKSVDRVRHARAFAGVNVAQMELLPALIIQLGFSRLLDLGCGNAGLLLELAASDPKFTGWGLEQNRAMYKVARGRIREARAGRRIRLLHGDCRELSSALPENVKSEVGAVSACNVANEMFAGGHSRIIKWLRELRKTLPGRPFLLVDYYGRLGQPFSRGTAALNATLLHDYAQVISGQGVPPANLKEWRSIYKRAACRLIHVFEDKATTRFIHLLNL